MRVVTVAGPPACGKSAVIAKSVEELQLQGIRPGAVKFDCVQTEDDALFRNLGIPATKALSGSVCPDHFFASNVEEAIQWAREEETEMLFLESAGLCNRCSPHMKDVIGVCVIDNLAGLEAPRKQGPMLRLADIVVMTKGDVVSQAEREVFLSRVRMVNPKAKVVQINGLTGQGAFQLARLLLEREAPSSMDSLELRFSMPSAVCSYCLGERRIGEKHQAGNVRKATFKRPQGATR